MVKEMVVKELESGTVLRCIVDHPGFNPVCLEKWGLRMAGDKFKIKEKQKYLQTGLEER